MDFPKRRLHHATEPGESRPQIGSPAAIQMRVPAAAQSSDQTLDHGTQSITSTVPKTRSVPLEMLDLQGFPIAEGNRPPSLSLQIDIRDFTGTSCASSCFPAALRDTTSASRTPGFAFTSCRRATLDTEAPGSIVSSTIAVAPGSFANGALFAALWFEVFDPMCPRFLFVDTNKSATKAIILTHTLGTYGRNRTLTSSRQFLARN